MARIRSVHPGLFTDEAFVSCSPTARYLAIGLWTEADDNGVFEWKPITIKMRLLPVDNVDVADLLAELERLNIIKRYSAAGREYGAVRNFRRYQRPKKPNSIHPLPDEFRTYVALDGASSELSEVSEHEGSEPEPVKPRAVPQKGEKSPQMEDGGKGKEEKKDDHQPLKPLALEVSDEEQFDYEVLLDQLCTAAGVVPDQRFPGLQVTGPITDMIDAGWSLEKHILPKIREIRLKGKSGTSWEYYATAVRKGADKPPKVAPPPAHLADTSSETFTQRRQREWRQQLAAWKKYGSWSDQWGAAPNTPSCAIPPEFVTEFERNFANGAAA